VGLARAVAQVGVGRPSERRALWSWRALIWGVGLVPMLVTPFYPRSFDLLSYTAALQEGFGVAGLVGRAATAFQVLLGVALVAYWGLLRRRRPMPSSLLWGVVALAVGPTLSTFWGISPQLSLGHLAAPLLLASTLFIPPVHIEWFANEVKKLLFLYVVASLMAAVVAPEWALESPYVQGYIPGLQVRLHGVTVHANHTAPFAWLLLLLEVAFPNRVRLLRFSILALSLLVFLLTQSKTMWALTALSISLLGFNFIWRQPLPKRVVGLLLFAGIGLMPASLLVLLPDVLDPLQRTVESRWEDLTSLTGRTVIWQTVLSIVEENPWFGYGPHLWDPEMALQYASWVGWMPAQSHNQYIQSLGEGGWIGLGGFILYGLILSINAFRVRRVGLGLPFVLVLAWFIRGFTESWYRKATTDGNLFIHMVIFALVVLAVRELRRGQSG